MSSPLNPNRTTYAVLPFGRPAYSDSCEYCAALFDDEASNFRRRAAGWHEHEVHDNGVIVWARPRLSNSFV